MHLDIILNAMGGDQCSPSQIINLRLENEGTGTQNSAVMSSDPQSFVTGSQVREKFFLCFSNMLLNEILSQMKFHEESL